MTIFGYTWDEIKRAQQGGALARRIPAGIYKPLATDGDWELLERYGEAELRNRNYFGVLDRLENTRMANDMPDCDRSACRDHSLRAGDNHDCPSLRPNDWFDQRAIKRRVAYPDKEQALVAARRIFGLKGGEL